MSTALYRRYRPETFADVIGQEHVTEPLMQALRSGRVNHAYLFSGPRGCGKTTSARILARCLNCEQGPTPEPCGTCDSCVALARGGPGSVDVIEIDAASHGGVDDARDLRERAAFGPAQARYKVYIIDEAHMVTSHGFNALLKVVEEPPEHVKFIFATTEPDKVLSTIRSRTHHYPFHLVPPQRLTGYLEELCAAEGVSLEPGVLSFVTRAGGGSVRDSLSVLDQLIAGADEGGVTYERAAALLGFTDAELLDSVVDAVGAQDAAAVFRQVDRVMESGHDPRRFVEDLLERYRDLIVVAAVGERAGALLRGIPEDQVERLRQQASVYGPSTLTRCADVIAKGLSEMTGAVSYRLHLELICARLLLPAAAGEEGYATRLDRIERRLAAGPAAPESAAPPVAPVTRRERQAPPTQPAPREEPPAPSPQPTQSAPAQGQPSPAQPRQPQQGAAQARQVPDQAAPQQERVRQPERRETQPPQPPAQPVHGQPSPEQPGQPQRPQEQPRQPQQGAAPGSLDTDAVRRAWPEVLEQIKEIRRVTWTLVSVNSTVLDFDGRRVLLGLSSEGLATTFNQGHHAEVVRQALIEAIGLDARVEGTAAPGGGQGAPQAPPPGRAPQGGPTPEGGPAPQSGGPAPQSGPVQSARPQQSGGPTWPGPSAPPAGDSAPPWDTAPRDTAAHDSAPRDSAPRDTAPRDTAPRDTAPRDTAPRDTAAPDTTPPWDTPQRDTAQEAAEPSAAEQLGVTGARTQGAPRQQGAPPAQEWAESAREAPPAWATQSPSQSAGDDRPAPPVGVDRPAPSAAPAAPTAGSPDPRSDESADQGSAAEPGGRTTPPTPAPSAAARRPTTPPVPSSSSPEQPPRTPGGDVPRDDDEDLESSGAVGLPVIESVLGGTVISIDDDPTH